MTIWRMPTRKPCACVFVSIFERFGKRKPATVQAPCQHRNVHAAEGVARGARSIECLRAATASAPLHGKPLMGKRLFRRPCATQTALTRLAPRAPFPV